MISRTLAAGLIAAGCVTAAAGGAYVGVRQNATAASPVAPAVSQLPAQAAVAGPTPVSETEAIVPAATPGDVVPVETPSEVTRPQPKPRPSAVPASARSRRVAPVRSERAIAPPAPSVVPEIEAEPALPTPSLPAPVTPEPVADIEPIAPPEPRFEEVVIPSSSVIGLQVETPVTSERAQVEDRVDARVTRDVLSAGRVAIPAGSRVIGAVTVVEKGGKVKERARLGVRFHTLVMADGRQVPLRTEAILREGDAPSGESARKIGGAAVGGAILGAIMGGKKGAIIGGATGAGAGTAAVMTGDRNAATLPAGTIVTVRLSAPATIEVERR